MFIENARFERDLYFEPGPFTEVINRYRKQRGLS